MANRMHSAKGALAVLVAALWMASGCEQKSQNPPAAGDGTTVHPSNATGAEQASGDSAASERVNAVLVKADAYDGETDKVVSNCPGCGLGMMGSSEHDLVVHGYHLHFCSDDCKAGFAKDPDKQLLAMKIPEN